MAGNPAKDLMVLQGERQVLHKTPACAVWVVSSEPKGSGGHHFALLGFQFPDMRTRARGGSR